MTPLITALQTVTALLEEHARSSDNATELKACREAQRAMREYPDDNTNWKARCQQAEALWRPICSFLQKNQALVGAKLGECLSVKLLAYLEAQRAMREHEAIQAYREELEKGNCHE